jgi:hypothetical protein
MTNREHAWRLLVTAAGCDGRISRAAAFELARKMCCGRTWADTTDEDHTEIIRRLTK